MNKIKDSNKTYNLKTGLTLLLIIHLFFTITMVSVAVGLYCQEQQVQSLGHSYLIDIEEGKLFIVHDSNCRCQNGINSQYLLDAVNYDRILIERMVKNEN